jgi:molybdate transport system substrate-binding protein
MNLTKTLRILSGGAAQGLVNAVGPVFEADAGYQLQGTFGAVGAMRQLLVGGEPADLVILTSSLIDELAATGFVSKDGAADLGLVDTSVAVREGDRRPEINDGKALRQSLLDADAIYFPDPKKATAGIHFAALLDRLGVRERLEKRLRPFPNGATAMDQLARSTERRPIGCTQVTEILATPGLALIGPLPSGYDLSTIYTAAPCQRAANPAPARDLIQRLAGPASSAERERAGFRRAV